jgi:flagellar biosynthesis/type III secretory pathway protein FliH
VDERVRAARYRHLLDRHEAEVVLLEARMIKGYEYQSDFARKYYSQGLQEGHAEGLQEGHAEGLQEGRAEGLQEGREEGLRRAIMALICARLPGLRDELEGWLRGQPEARLVQLITELDQAHDEDSVRTMIERRS